MIIWQLSETEWQSNKEFANIWYWWIEPKMRWIIQEDYAISSDRPRTIDERMNERWQTLEKAEAPEYTHLKLEASNKQYPIRLLCAS